LVLSMLGSLTAAAVLYFSAARCLAVATINLPCSVEQTALTVLELRSYDGPYLEDGSRRQVHGVAAVVVHNGGERLLEHGAVKLRQGEDLLVFSFSMLPPGGRLLILEQSAKSFSDTPVNACWGWSVAGETDVRIQTEESGRTSLTLINVTDEAVDSVRVYYKDYDPVGRMLVGGISYSVHVKRLEPGHRATLPAFAYLSGTSMVIG